MSNKSFFDTNVVFYAYDSSDSSKQAKAQALLRTAAQDGNGVLSAQVLGEFFHATVIRKGLLTAAEAERAINSWAFMQLISIDVPLVRAAIAYHRRFQVRYWDGLILATAKQAGCAILLTEDFNDGQDYDGVKALNPFTNIGP